jgi:Ni/Co efflux regulator RcnB
LAQPQGDEGHSNRVGKASVAPEVQDRAQAELRRQAQPQGGNRSENGRGERAPAAQNTIQSAPPAPVNRDNRGDQRGRGDHVSAPTTQAIQSPSNRGDGASRDRWQGRGDRGYRQGQDNRNATGRDFNRPDFNRDGRTDYRPNTRSGAGGPRHDVSGFRDYHRDFNASRRFNAPGYRRPAGWYDHRWSFGELLPSAFWARDYWLDDFQAYDLPPPPYGAVWVRVGNDALLVDEDTGEIITVAYSVFY